MNKTMKWFVGLGNPGSKYEMTRHNIGFTALDAFAERWNIKFTMQPKLKAFVGEGLVHGTKVYLVKPQTYMNLSGESVRAFLDFYKAAVVDMVVIYDDLDTEFGRIRLRLQGSPGGHNGIKSIIQHIGTQTFNRIRIGISRPEPGFDIADYVLSSFHKSDMPVLRQVVDWAVDAMEATLQEPFEKTMAVYNASRG